MTITAADVNHIIAHIDRQLHLLNHAIDGLDDAAQKLFNTTEELRAAIVAAQPESET